MNLYLLQSGLTEARGAASVTRVSVTFRTGSFGSFSKTMMHTIKNCPAKYMKRSALVADRARWRSERQTRESRDFAKSEIDQFLRNFPSVVGNRKEQIAPHCFRLSRRAIGYCREFSS